MSKAGWASALGAALQQGGATFTSLGNQQRQQRRQQEMDALTLAEHKAQQEAHRAAMESTALNQALLKSQIDQQPVNNARASAKSMLEMQGDAAYDNPEFISLLEKIGQPMQKKEIALSSRGISGMAQGPAFADNGDITESAKGKLNFGPMNTQEDIAGRAGVSASTGVMLPPDVAVRNAQNRQKGAQANFMADLFSGKGNTAMTPDQANRVRLAATTGIAGTELNTILGLPTGSKGQYAATDAALVQKIMENPAAFEKLPAATQDRISGQLAQAGFDFKTPQAPPSEYTTERNERVLASVRELKDGINGWTTGWGATLRHLPATDAKAFEGKLKTLTANIAFNELNEMRAASRTGGALGAVSDTEIALLSATLGSLIQEQDGAALKEQLDKVEASIQRWQAAKARYGAPQQQSSPRTPQPPPQAPPGLPPMAPVTSRQSAQGGGLPPMSPVSSRQSVPQQVAPPPPPPPPPPAGFDESAIARFAQLKNMTVEQVKAQLIAEGRLAR